MDHGEGDYCSVDVDKVDMNKYPSLQDIPWWSAHMDAGDCMYIPYGWVTTSTCSMSYYNYILPSFILCAVSIFFSQSVFLSLANIGLFLSLVSFSSPPSKVSKLHTYLNCNVSVLLYFLYLKVYNLPVASTFFFQVGTSGPLSFQKHCSKHLVGANAFFQYNRLPRYSRSFIQKMGKEKIDPT